jgi:hypothetical protein
MTDEGVVTAAVMAPRATWRLPGQLSINGAPALPASAAVPHKGAQQQPGGALLSSTSLHGALFLVAGFTGSLSVYENYCPAAVAAAGAQGDR